MQVPQNNRVQLETKENARRRKKAEYNANFEYLRDHIYVETKMNKLGFEGKFSI